jgi:hypothetical protein
MASSLINLIGFTIGAILYAMLLAMIARSRPSRADGLSLVTAILGFLWNAGAFWGYGLPALGVVESSPLILALAFSALGFLPATVVHSVLRSRGALATPRNAGILWAAYLLSSTAAALHLAAALAWRATPSHYALQISTAGFAAVLVALWLSTRKTPGSSSAFWVVGLAVFAVSALHLSNHTGADPWWLELAGHHASLPLVLAFLHQDYRFALADIFLKRALALLILVSAVFGLFEIGLNPLIGAWSRADASDPRTVLPMLILWTATALAYPWMRSAAGWFVDTVVLRRPDYDQLLAEAAEIASRHDTAEDILESLREFIGKAFSARSAEWRRTSAPAPAFTSALLAAGPRGATALIPTVEAPRYEFTIAELEGGRRLLSGDLAALEKLAVLMARRIDLVRTASERFERDLREREMSRLATEAELRALQAQIQPHFLFNALTTIGYLIQTAPDRALTTLLRLSGLLRSVLGANAEFTTLGEELRFITAYLDIESARFEDRLQVNIDVPGPLRSMRVPTMLLQPLVENAIKHGIGPTAQGGEVRISAATVETPSGPTLRLIVADTGAGAGETAFHEGRKRGVGLNNVERRLQCYGSSQASMRISSAPGLGARIELLLPAQSEAGTKAPEPVSARTP